MDGGSEAPATTKVRASVSRTVRSTSLGDLLESVEIGCVLTGLDGVGCWRPRWGNPAWSWRPEGSCGCRGARPTRLRMRGPRRCTCWRWPCRAGSRSCSPNSRRTWWPGRPPGSGRVRRGGSASRRSHARTPHHRTQRPGTAGLVEPAQATISRPRRGIFLGREHADESGESGRSLRSGSRRPECRDRGVARGTAGRRDYRDTAPSASWNAH